MSTADWISNLYVFLLASFLGLQLITHVSRLLHTPLMSLTNAISSIALVGSLLLAGESLTPTSTVLGVLAIAASFTNAVGGFLITERILRMFRRKDR
ncbi:NAD(P) transhydrogenase subunit alpha [Candidatus Methylacidithermus pantelleriae]|uniref:NAD(P) transhydrogenase subunit alpha n=1 Tax=Candidatus Methylacidithermus pantelleriae TaxID=2744239 RepID=UPI00157DA678|nr:NAD(P) transhydrogenase subunit alpha [Candidatus Methylacidithermus pantelleriae]